jgi:aminoglycoside phosphotransferase family enzyme/predicted kinase
MTAGLRREIEELPAGLVADLGRAAAYPPEARADRELAPVQTHISHVFLTATRVYKLRKAVAFPFLSFATRAERNADCLRELRLNRRLAPDVYLGVAPLLRRDGGFAVGETGEALAPGGAGGRAPEHCVVMRRLPDGRDAQSLLAAGRLERGMVEAAAERVAHFHEGHRLGRPAPFAPDEWLARCEAPVLENLRLLREDAPGSPLAERAARVETAARRWLRERARDFEERRVRGLAVDGHGDLQLQHLWFEGDRREPLIIDCTEFNEDFRRIDAASEVAFLAMDLRYRGSADLAALFLRRYARETDDFHLYAVLDYFVSYRAAVRSKVAELASREPEIDARQREAAAASAERHLRLAEEALAESGPGALVVLCGTVGSGKSTAAELLADATGGAVVSSDRTRKRMAGLAATERVSGEREQALYSAEQSERVYAGLLERAEPVVRSGRVAVLDATHASRARRERALAWARERGVAARLVQTTCAREEALARLARRRESGRDPSDAGPELYRASIQGFEPPEEWPAADRTEVDTSAPGWRDALEALARRVADASHCEPGGSASD